MTLVPSSLSGRILLGMTLFTMVALAVTLVVMDRVFDRFVTGQIDQRLDNKIVSLRSQIVWSADGTVRLAGDADGPPFDEPRHRALWCVVGPRNTIESAWVPPGGFRPPSASEIAAAPAPPRPDRSDAREPPPRTLLWPGVDGRMMHVRATVATRDGRTVVVLAAAPSEAIEGPLREALSTLASAIVVLAVLSLFASLLFTRLSLAPLARLRDEIAAVRIGRAARVSGSHPSEVRPLVDELNDLLHQNAENLARARKHVANLAHGLKTPLATLSLNVARQGEDVRTQLQPLVTTIERRVRHHLGRARAAALEGPVRLQTPLRAHIVDIAEALLKIYAEKQVAFSIDCAGALAVACEPQDLDEILGNILDNAFKFTRGTVSAVAGAGDGMIEVAILDDGQGLDDDEIAHVLRPGQRLDEQVPGFGFGLPIARELVELYGGALTLTPQARGLRVSVHLPMARA